MYLSFFGMQQRPFGATSHLRDYFAASGQEAALATLRYAVIQGRGFGLLTGPSGTGKTVLCHRLATGLEAAYRTAMVSNTNLATIKALYQAILYDLSLPFQGRDEQELRLTLTDFLVGKYASGGRMVLIIDEAQNLSIPLLEELRMLSNIERDAGKLIQIVLVGHSRLLELLRSPALETLNQRIDARATLHPLGDEETVNYIRHQMQCAGVRPDAIFADDALAAVFEATAGIPRLINQLCEYALLLAYDVASSRVDVGLIERACTALQRTGDRLEDQYAADVPTTRAAAAPADSKQGRATPMADAVPTREYHSAIRLAHESDECVNDCLEFVAGDSAEIGNPRDDVFVEDEVVVDPYAMMDGARSTVSQRRLSTQITDPARQVERPRELPSGSVVLPQAHQPTCEPNREDETCAIPFDKGQVNESPTPINFVEPSDNPAVHEVGAGVVEQATELKSPVQLTIENRSQRVVEYHARVDIPGKADTAAPRAYRRLFTHARKP